MLKAGRAGAQLLGEMKARGMPIGKLMYRTLMDAFAYRGFYQEVQALLDEQSARGLAIPPFQYTLLLHAYWCDKLIN